MKFISCNLNLFALDHVVYLHDGEEVRTLGVITMDDAAFALAEFCHQEQVDKVHLIGIQAQLKPIVEDIIILSSTKYNNSNLVVEVN